MSLVLQRLMVVFLRLLLVAVGAVVALAVFFGVVVLFLVWALRRGWARLTGRPVAPWVLRVDPLAVWRQARAFRRGASAAASPSSSASQRREMQDVTDVTPK